MKSVPNLALEQIYPPICGDLDLNTCQDPDCGNFGISAVATFRLMGRNARARLASSGSNSTMIGLGKYKLATTKGPAHRRISTVFEYQGDPHSWLDRKNLECQFHRTAGPCGSHFEILSNEQLFHEVDRLRSANGAFVGPRCRACGRDYLEAPDEFILDGAEITPPREDNDATGRKSGRRTRSLDSAATPDRVRLIHKPCRGQSGARISATLDHRRHRRSADNVAILLALVNGAGIAKIMRMMSPAGSGKSCGAKRVYDRIFWLERTLLAFERTQIARWKAEREASGEPSRHHLAHDDIVLSVNWETSRDRRLTQLNCSATADVRSGYVFRLDVDFDPTVDPVSLFEQAYVDDAGGMKNLRKAYQQKGGLAFTAPLMSFQRPTGRFEEHHLFAAAAHQLALFREQVLERMPDATAAQQIEKAQILAELDDRIARVDAVHDGYFNVPESERDYRSTFNGIVTRDIYTKAAHFVLLREMLPSGVFRLITEQEGTLPGILPHIFRKEILEDRFRWIAMTFDKEVKKPEMQHRVSVFKRNFEAFVNGLRAADPAAEAAMTNGQRLRAFIAVHMRTAVRLDRFGTAVPFQSANFQQPFMPMVWIESPIQTAGESNKVVGFPLMRGARRGELKTIPFDGSITNPDTRAAVAFHVWSATLQPVSTFFNALRERLSFARRAGGRSSRSGGTYVNGAAFNPRVLIAVLNIFRVYYNWFEPRQYVAPWTEDGGAVDGPGGEIATRIPGTDKVIPLSRRRARRPIMRTPAMRLGIQTAKHDANGRLVVPSLHRVLYRPWIYERTPLWDKFENPKGDGRRRKRTQ